MGGTSVGSLTLVIKRFYGSHGSFDYLCGFDVIWGPVWTGSEAQALRFTDPDKAYLAIDAAVAIMAPRPWCVPDFGARSPVAAYALGT